MKKIPDPIDIFVGQKIREYRLLHGYTQTALADQLQITFQQVQKYENGSNRVSASKLFTIAITLMVSIEKFFPQRHDGLCLSVDNYSAT